MALVFLRAPFLPCPFPPLNEPLQINLPFGALSLTAITLFLPFHPPLGARGNDDRSPFQKWLDIDWIGVVLSLGAVTCIIMALQWAGVTRPWKDGAVIALFVLVSIHSHVYIHGY
jgi:hypothetical protein